jgi:hypothetical protein
MSYIDMIAVSWIMMGIAIVLWGFWPDLQDLLRGKRD